MFLSYELEHLGLVEEMLKKYEHKAPEKIIGSEIQEPSRFDPQKEYIEKVIKEQVYLRLTDGKNKDFTKYSGLPGSWPIHEIHSHQKNSKK